MSHAIVTEAKPRRLLGNHTVWVLFSLWLVIVVSGMMVLVAYSNEAGDSGHPPLAWPGENMASSDSSKYRLLMFAHPRCPCTRASISELARIMADARGTVTARVLFYQPLESTDEWAHTDLWEHAKAIPGVAVGTDLDGLEAERFGADASGQVLLYDSKGDLAFNGGITAGRGHEGDNAGRNAIIAIVRGGRTDQRVTPVFGCAISGDKESEDPVR